MSIFWKIIWWTLFGALLVSALFLGFMKGLVSAVSGFNEFVMPNLPLEFKAVVYMVFLVVISAVIYSLSGRK